MKIETVTGNENHTQTAGIDVRAGVKGGKLSANENQTVLNAVPKVCVGVKGGRLILNENEKLAEVTPQVRSGIKAGKLSANWNQTLDSVKARSIPRR
jgi:hypothetical protein